MKLNLNQRAPRSAIIVLAIIVVALFLPQLGRVLGAFVHPDSPPPTQNSDNAQSSSVSSSSDPEKEWHLGNVTVSRDEPSKDGTESYSFSLGTGRLGVYFKRGADGKLTPAATLWNTDSVFTMTADSYEFAPSNIKLTAKLPIKENKALDFAQSIAKEADSTWYWPPSLLPARPMVRDIAQGKVRLIVPVALSVNTSATAYYADTEVVELLGVCNIWKDRCVFHPYFTPLIELTPDGGVVYANDEVSADKGWKTAGLELHRRLLIAQIFPDVAGTIYERGTTAYGWWSAAKYKVAPAKPLSERSALTTPWSVEEDASEGETPEVSDYNEIKPITIGGVRITGFVKSPSHGTTLEMNGKTVLWSAAPGGGIFKTSDEIMATMSVHLRTNARYPVISGMFSSAKTEDNLQIVRSLTEALHSANDTEWPEELWSKCLRADVETMRAGRYWVFQGNDDMCTVYARQIFAGSTCYVEAFADTRRIEENDGIRIELKLDTDGFSVYDAKNGCLLEVTEGGVKLTQRSADFILGDVFNLTAAKALTSYVETGKDKLTPELMASLSKALVFFANPSLPKPEFAEFTTPAWSYSAEHYVEETTDEDSGVTSETLP